MKNTLVLGASENPSRYSNLAVNRLKNNGIPVIAVGKTRGNINGTEILTEIPPDAKVHTVTLYLNPAHQLSIYKSILILQPERVIFNPGTENHEFQEMLSQAGIEVVHACTLVMLSTDTY